MFVLRFIRHLPNVLRHRAEFKLGWQEAPNHDGMTYDDDPWSDRSMAYDSGRDLRLKGRS